jgi:hypothetical protein
MAARMALRPFARPSGDTVGRFLFEIVTITVGILIALWIDEVRERRRDEALVRTAREQLTREVADNLRDVEGTGTSRQAHGKALAQALQIIEDLRDRGTTSAGPTGIGLGSPSFPRSAWDTAGRTGALALMEYSDVKRFSEIYDLQDLVDRAQERYVVRLTQDSPQFMTVVARRGTGTPPDRAELDAARVQALALAGSFRFYQELLTQLVRQYKLVQPR